MEIQLSFEVGDDLYIAYPEKNTVHRFETSCVKIFKGNDIRVHGWEWLTTYALAKEYSLKYLNRRCIFTTEEGAKAWIESIRKGKSNGVDA